MINPQKYCSGCSRYLNRSEFFKRGKYWRSQCKQCHRKKCKEYEKKTDGYLEAAKQRSKDRYSKVRNAVLDHYGRTCKCCGETKEYFLCLDHITGGGKKHHESVRNRTSEGVQGKNFYEWVVKNNFPPLFQILCWNCNFAKHKFGICPCQDSLDLLSASIMS